MLYFKQQYPGATIHAFEPNYTSYHLLCKNIADNHFHTVLSHNAAVAKKHGVAHFYAPKKETDYSWGNTILPGRFKSGTFQDTKVATVPLSAYITRTVDFLKLDVEGSELDVLTEIRPKLHNVREMVLELHTWGRNKTDIYTRVIRLLDGVMTIQSFRKVGMIMSAKITRSSLPSTPSDLFLIRATAA